jgi:drug/metabolite transporter (DMT)-like permease
MNPRFAVPAMLLAVVIYGANFVYSRYGILDGLTAADLTAIRFCGAGILLLPFFVRRGIADCAGIGWGRGIALAITSGVPFGLCMNIGLSLAPASHGVALQPGTVTVFSVALGAVLARRLPPRLVVVGTALVMLGLAVIAWAGGGSGSNVLLGDLCFILAGCLWGTYPFLLHRWRVDPMVAAAVIGVLSLAYLPFYLGLSEPRILQVGWRPILVQIVNLSLLNMIVGIWLWGQGIRILGAARAQQFAPLIPVVGTLMALPVLGERPGPLLAVGAMLVVAGLATAAYAGRRQADLTRH